MIKKIIGLALGATLLALSFPVQAQQPTKVPRIGWLTASTLSAARVEAFRQGLRELGYASGSGGAGTILITRDRGESWQKLNIELPADRVLWAVAD
ncbi:MAG: hypothetical protein ACREQA_12925 [Candidatus Binatia bacterium]